MKMVYASRWMLDALASAGQPRTVLLDLPALLNTLSAEDVAFYVAANNNLASFLPKEIFESFHRVNFDLSDPKLAKVRDALQRIEVSGKAAIPAEADDARQMLTSDLFDADAIVFQHILKETAQEGAFRVAHIAERVLRQMATVLRYEQYIVLPIARWYMEARQQILTPNRIVA